MPLIIKQTVVLTAIFLITPPVAAHHSTAIFDLSSDIRLEGVVTKLRWANPHVYIQIETLNNAGEGDAWNIEGQTPAGMTREGWTDQSLKPGDKVFIAANPGRDPVRKIALGHTVIKEDGTILEIPQLNSRRTQAPIEQPTPAPAESLSGHWVTRWNPAVALGFLRARTSWSLTDKGIAAMDAYDSSMNPGNDCVPEPLPYVMIWPTGKEIEVGDELVVIRDELGPDRRIEIDATSHDAAVPTDSGHSIGRWVDGALLVDTAIFSDHRRGLSVGGLASGSRKQLTERFELNSDRTVLQYWFRLEDPEFLAEPVTGNLELAHRPDLPFVSEPCDMESARIYLGE